MENLKNHQSGHLHPITILADKIGDIFIKMGFDIVTGRELERE